MRLLVVQQLTRFDLTLFYLSIDLLIYMLQAAKAYEDHCAKNGRPDSHAKAKEVL